MQRAVFDQGGDGDRLGGVGIFADVVEEIVEHPLQIHHVGLDLHLLLRQKQLDHKALLLQLNAALAQQLLEKQTRIVDLKLHGKLLAAEQQRVPEQLIGQRLELLGLAVGGVQIALQLVFRAVLPVFRKIQIAEQRRKRIADVVGHGGDEVAVLLEGALLLAGLAQERQAHLLDAGRELRKLVASLRLKL